MELRRRQALPEVPWPAETRLFTRAVERELHPKSWPAASHSIQVGELQSKQSLAFGAGKRVKTSFSKAFTLATIAPTHAR